MIKVNIKFFGIFSDYFDENKTILLHTGDSIKDLRHLMIQEIKYIDKTLNLEILVHSSFFSNSKEILEEDYLIQDNDIIYFLPPVSGG